MKSKNAFFSSLFLLSTKLICAMQIDHIAAAEGFIKTAAKKCNEAAIIKQAQDPSKRSTAKNFYSQATSNLSHAFQQLLNAHDNCHLTALPLAKQVFEVMQQIQGARMEYRRYGTISLSPEITETLLKFRKYSGKSEEMSWQEFVQESW